MPTLINARYRLALVAFALLLSGCGGPPQIGSKNRRLVESLATAASARNPQWLAENVTLIEARRAEGQVPDAEYAAFRSIITHGEAGRWAEAEAEAFALREAQTASAEDEALAESRPAPESRPRPRMRSALGANRGDAGRAQAVQGAQGH